MTHAGRKPALTAEPGTITRGTVGLTGGTTMPRPGTKRSSAWINGYEPGSIMHQHREDRAWMKRFQAWMRQHDDDARAFMNTARRAGWAVGEYKTRDPGQG